MCISFLYTNTEIQWICSLCCFFSNFCIMISSLPAKITSTQKTATTKYWFMRSLIMQEYQVSRPSHIVHQNSCIESGVAVDVKIKNAELSTDCIS